MSPRTKLLFFLWFLAHLLAVGLSTNEPIIGLLLRGEYELDYVSELSILPERGEYPGKAQWEL